MSGQKRILVPFIERDPVLSAVSVVHRAYLDALREIEDLRQLPDHARSDHLIYWEAEAHRLEAAHAWLLDILARQ